MDGIRITSDGTTQGTRVTTPAGEELKYITRIEILPMTEAGQPVRVVMTFACVSFDVVAEMVEE